MAAAATGLILQSYAMLARLYVEALLTDECAADAVWELWDRGMLTNAEAARAWLRVAVEWKDEKQSSTAGRTAG